MKKSIGNGLYTDGKGGSLFLEGVSIRRWCLGGNGGGSRFFRWCQSTRRWVFWWRLLGMMVLLVDMVDDYFNMHDVEWWRC